MAYPASNVANLASNIAYPASNVANLASNIAYPASNVANLASNVAYPASNVANLASNIAYLASNVANRASNVAYPASNVANLASNVAYSTSNFVYAGGVWSKSGNNLFYTAGNVGVNTTSPLERIHVNGNIFSESQILGTSNDSVITPAISFRGDANTGIYHAAHGTVGITTAGQERMRVTSTGNVGVATTSPQAQLHVGGDLQVDSNIVISRAMIMQGIRVRRNVGTGTANLAAPNINGYSNDTSGSTFVFSTQSNANAFVSWGVGATSNEVVRITSSGNVGIGTSTPEYKLDVTGTVGVNNFIQFPNTDGGKRVVLWDSGTGGYVGIGKDASAITYAVHATTNFHRFVAFNGSTPNELMRILGTGNVGVNTQSPSNLLTVAGNASIGALYSNVNAPANGMIVVGNVGIGTSNPSHLLDVRGTTRMLASGTWLTARDGFNNTLTDFARDITNNNTIVTVSFGSFIVNATNHVSFQPTNNVGIGTSNPTFKLDVRGGVGISNAIQFTPNTNVVKKIILTERTDNVAGFCGFGRDNDGTVYHIQDTGNVHKFMTFNQGTGSYVELMRIAGGGNVGLSSTTPSNVLTVGGAASIGGAYSNVNAPTDGMIVVGNVGVGLSNPTRRFHVRAPTSNLAFLQADTNSINQIAGVEMGITGVTSKITATTKASDKIDMTFTVQNGTNLPVRAMYIQENGYVGIGTDTPTSMLSLRSSTAVGGIQIEPGLTSSGNIAGHHAINFNGYYSNAEIALNTAKNRWRIMVDQKTGNDHMIIDTWKSGTGLSPATSELIRFTSNLNIGVGVFTPAYRLDINGTLNATTIHQGGSTLASLFTAANTCLPLAGGTMTGNINFSTSEQGIYWTNIDTDGARIVFVDDSGATNRGYLLIKTTDDGNEPIVFAQGGADNTITGATGLERMRIDGNGRLGIGTSSPSYLLDVSGSARVQSDLFIGNTSAKKGIYFGGTAGDSGYTYSGILNRNYSENNNATLNANNDFTELLMFQLNDSESTVGPDRIRHIAAAHKWQVYNRNLGGGGFNLTVDDNNTFYADSNFTDAMYINQTGNVGIGTTSPGYKLDVRGNMRIGSGDTQSQLLLSDVSQANWLITTGGSRLDFTNDNGGTYNTKLCVQTGGNVGIGTTSPAYKLDVTGTLNASTIYQGGSTLSSLFTAANTCLPLAGGTMTGDINFSTSGRAVKWTNINSDGAEVSFTSVGTGIGESYLTLKTIGEGNDPILFQQNANVRMRIATNGGVNCAVELFTPAMYLNTYQFGMNPNNNSLNLFTSNVGAGTVGGMQFSRNDGTMTYMRLLNNGRAWFSSNVGVGGITDPTCPLDIRNANYDTLFLRTRDGYDTEMFTIGRSPIGSGTYGCAMNDKGNIFIQSTSGKNVLIGTTTNSDTYKLYVSGAIYATGAITELSDARYKTDVRQIENALSIVDSMKGYSYKKSDTKQEVYKMTDTNVGFLAQELKDVLPEVVTYDADTDRYGVIYSNITAVLVEALKEMHHKYKKLEDEIATIKAHLKMP